MVTGQLHFTSSYYVDILQIIWKTFGIIEIFGTYDIYGNATFQDCRTRMVVLTTPYPKNIYKYHKKSYFFSQNNFCKELCYGSNKKHLHRNRRFSSNRQDNIHMQKKNKQTHWHSLLIGWVKPADKAVIFTYGQRTN